MKKDSNDWIEVKPRSYAPWADWDGVKTLIGTVVSKRTIEWEGKRKYVIEIEMDNGERVSVGETGLLKLEQIDEGDMIKIENRGWIRLKNGRRARDLKLYVKKAPF